MNLGAHTHVRTLGLAFALNLGDTWSPAMHASKCKQGLERLYSWKCTVPCMHELKLWTHLHTEHTEACTCAALPVVTVASEGSSATITVQNKRQHTGRNTHHRQIHARCETNSVFTAEYPRAQMQYTHTHTYTYTYTYTCAHTHTQHIHTALYTKRVFTAEYPRAQMQYTHTHTVTHTHSL
jgi:hypothetical protein